MGNRASAASDLDVVPFGTSSGRPTAERHVSGLGVRLGPRWLLVDCGEGTQQQVMRSPLKLSRLDAVLLTHLHGDHVLGLPGLLGTLAMEGRTKPLPVVGPVGLRTWLDVMLALPILGLTFDLVVTELAAPPEADASGPWALGTFAGFGVSTLPLVHRVPSFGYRLEEPTRPGRVDADRASALGLDGPDIGRIQRGENLRGIDLAAISGPERAGRVVTVLGDTTRAATSVALARDADLLVHECTYAEAEHDLCVQWTHSCTADVASVVAEAGSNEVVLTHFSARYDDPQVLAIEVRAGLAALGSDATVQVATEGVPIPVVTQTPGSVAPGPQPS